MRMHDYGSFALRSARDHRPGQGPALKVKAIMQRRW
jgi:hypothetical protein